MSSLALLFMSLLYHITISRLVFFDSMTYECVCFVHEAMILYCEKRAALLNLGHKKKSKA